MTQLAKKRILFVEDDPLSAATESLRLRKNGYDVVCISSGEESIDFIQTKKQSVDLVLMDIELGQGMDGVDSAEMILKSHDIPVVFLSAHSEKEIVEKTQKIKSYGYVLKNSGEAVLSASINMAFKNFEANQRLSLELAENKKTKENHGMHIKSEPKTNQAMIEMLERISDAFVSLDNHWCYTYMNKNAGEIFNRDPEKMIGKHIWSEFPEGINQPFHKAYEKAYLDQTYIYIEAYYPPFDKWFVNHIYPSLDGVSIFFQDITQQKKTEQRIKENEERFRRAVEEAPYPMAIYREDGKILHLSRGWTLHSGYTLEDIPTSEDWVLKAYPDTMDSKKKNHRRFV